MIITCLKLLCSVSQATTVSPHQIRHLEIECSFRQSHGYNAYAIPLNLLYFELFPRRRFRLFLTMPTMLLHLNSNQYPTYVSSYKIIKLSSLHNREQLIKFQNHEFENGSCQILLYNSTTLLGFFSAEKLDLVDIATQLCNAQKY